MRAVLSHGLGPPALLPSVGGFHHVHTRETILTNSQIPASDPVLVAPETQGDDETTRVSPSRCSTCHRRGACSFWHTGHCSSQFRLESISGLCAPLGHCQTGLYSSSHFNVARRDFRRSRQQRSSNSDQRAATPGGLSFKPPSEPYALCRIGIAC
jgi:hypothetical protein